MFSKNPRRANGVSINKAVTANLSSTAVQPNTQQLYEMLVQANQRIAHLEARLQQFEMSFYVGPGGDVEISSGSRIRIVAGQNVEISGDNSVQLSGGQSVNLDDHNGNSIRLGADGITNSCTAKFKTNSSSVEANAATTKFSGVVQCETLIANTVAGTTYTPGAGNIW